MIEKKEFPVPDASYQARITDSFNRQGFMRLIGARIDALAPGQCVIIIDFREDLAQQHGFFHGGLVGALADNAGAYAAFTLIEATQSMLTVEYKINLLAPAKGRTLRAVGEVVRAGRTLTVSQVRVSVLDNGAEQLCALGTVTMMTLMTRGDGK
jgi:uncharacterized protein (TIGR00369 family)